MGLFGLYSFLGGLTGGPNLARQICGLRWAYLTGGPSP
jgi:hypothetical protein